MRPQATDVELLASLGYKQELKREFRPLELFGLAFSYIGLFPSIASTLSLSLPNGGLTTFVWGWAVCSFFGMCVALALAELSSAAPTAGGLYYWTFKYAPPRWRHLLCWIVGYNNTMGFTAASASVTWALAVQVMAAVSIGSDLAFTPTTGQLFAVYVGLYILSATLASVGTRVIARFQMTFVCLMFLLCLGVIIAVPAVTPPQLKNTAADVFGKFTSLSDWTPGFAFILGFTGPLWVMGGYDAPIHISEEASNASTAVPISIVASFSAAVILGFGVNFALAFNMGTDIQAIIDSPVGQPMAAILFNSLGKQGTLVIWALLLLSQMAVAINGLVAASRQAFAFSRDGALPLSRYLYRINTVTGTPVNCVWGATSLGLLLGLFSFAGPTAINAVFTVAIVGSYGAFSIPIACRLYHGASWKPGPFSLGKLSTPVTTVAVLWTVFAVIVVMFPSSMHPTAETMNYTVAVGGGWIGLCIVYFYLPRFGGVHWFRGPLSTIESDTPSRAYSLIEIKEDSSQESESK